MIPSEPTSPRLDDESPSILWPAVRAIGFSLLAVVALGALVGFLSSAAEHGWKHSATAYVALAAILVVLFGSAWLAIRALRELRPGPASPRTTKARKMLYISAAIGAVVGGVLQLGGIDHGMLLEGPLPPAIALFAMAILLVGVPVVSWIWWRNIDEHEAQAYKDGALVGMYAYAAIATIWWLGWRGGFFAEPHTMIILLVVMAVWGIVWAYRRYA